MQKTALDTLDLCKKLISFQSVFPKDDGCAQYLCDFLSDCGFKSEQKKFSLQNGCEAIENVVAYNPLGSSSNSSPDSSLASSKVLIFSGHFDVVPEGGAWQHSAFTPMVENGFLFGRGVADMKGGIAAFSIAAAKYLKKNPHANIHFILTGDEEMHSDCGMKKLLPYIKSVIKNSNSTASENNCCVLVGEPSSNINIGDRVYKGHRGGIIIDVKAFGKVGHVAYENNFNALSYLCEFISMLKQYEFEHKSLEFPKAKAEVTMIYASNYAENVIPDFANAKINLRYGNDYTFDEIKEIFHQIGRLLKQKYEPKYETCGAQNLLDLQFDFVQVGAPYVLENEELMQKLETAIFNQTKIKPHFCCDGGLSDGRFLYNLCPVIEFGVQDETIHKTDENVKVDDLYLLEKIYYNFLELYFEH